MFRNVIEFRNLGALPATIMEWDGDENMVTAKKLSILGFVRAARREWRRMLWRNNGRAEAIFFACFNKAIE